MALDTMGAALTILSPREARVVENIEALSPASGVQERDCFKAAQTHRPKPLSRRGKAANAMLELTKNAERAYLSSDDSLMQKKISLTTKRRPSALVTNNPTLHDLMVTCDGVVAHDGGM